MKTNNLILLDFISNHTTSRIKYSTTSTLTTSQNKVMIIAYFVFCTFFSVCYFLLKLNNLNFNKKIKLLDDSKTKSNIYKPKTVKADELELKDIPNTLQPQNFILCVSERDIDNPSTTIQQIFKAEDNAAKAHTEIDQSKVNASKPEVAKVDETRVDALESVKVEDLQTAKKDEQFISKSSKKSRLKIINAADYLDQDRALEKVAKINKNSGMYDIVERLKKEYKGEKQYQTLLAIKNRKIIGYLSGEIQKSVNIEEANIIADRFYVHHFWVHKDWNCFPSKKYKIETKLMLAAVEKAKTLGIDLLSFRYHIKTDDIWGTKTLWEIPQKTEVFYTDLDLLLSKCQVTFFEKILKDDDDIYDTNIYKHKTYGVKNFQYHEQD